MNHREKPIFGLSYTMLKLITIYYCTARAMTLINESKRNTPACASPFFLVDLFCHFRVRQIQLFHHPNMRHHLECGVNGNMWNQFRVANFTV